jgi:hypothetical protein
MKTKILTKVLISAIGIALCFAGCKKDDAIYFSTLEKLYLMDKTVEISECINNNNMVYVVADNAYDAGAVVYDDKGKRIGICNYAWGHPDPICGQLQGCKVIYRCHGFITGEPFVDVYGLSN